MHDLMVKPLPAQCRLTAVFDVSQSTYDIIYDRLTNCRSVVILGLFSVRPNLSSCL